MEDERDETGRFRKGVSGNPKGRPTKERKYHGTPVMNRLAIFRIMEQEVPVRSADGVASKSLYEAIFEKAAIMAAGGDRQAMKLVLDATNRAAEENEKQIDTIESLKMQIAMLEIDLREWERNYPRKTHGVLVMPAKEPAE